MGQTIPGILPSWVGQTIPGIPGSSHFRNGWVKSFPEFPSGQTTPTIGKVGQMISGIFRDGEWTGKFVVEVFDGLYTVKVYALYYESATIADNYYKSEKTVKGRLFDAVIKKDGVTFKKLQLVNLTLLSQSLRDSFTLLAQ
ncbi:MAG: hypothetical protein ACKODM_04300 [Cytophagales bacterium]